MDRHKPADPGAAPYVPANATLAGLWDAAQKCKGCDLYRHATQAVLGEGRRSARIMMVGEQPGDQEDRQGKPFVGPAGRLLDKALQDAGIARKDVYVTNAVKHFKFEERGKRRIHKKPGGREIAACSPWLEAEIGLVRPALIVCLGATAARAVIGKQHRLLEQRGQFFDHPSGAKVMATVHPSAVLRAPDADRRHADYQAFVEDLAGVHSMLQPHAKMHA